MKRKSYLLLFECRKGMKFLISPPCLLKSAPIESCINFSIVLTSSQAYSLSYRHTVLLEWISLTFKMLRYFQVNEGRLWTESNKCLFFLWLVKPILIDRYLKWGRGQWLLHWGHFQVLVFNNEWRNIWWKTATYAEMCHWTHFFA